MIDYGNEFICFVSQRRAYAHGRALLAPLSSIIYWPSGGDSSFSCQIHVIGDPRTASSIVPYQMNLVPHRHVRVCTQASFRVVKVSYTSIFARTFCPHNNLLYSLCHNCRSVGISSAQSSVNCMSNWAYYIILLLIYSIYRRNYYTIKEYNMERSIRKWVLWISFYNIKFKSIYLPSY